MKFQVKKEFLLTANEGEMEKLATAVRNQITKMAKETVESDELIDLYPNPAKEFIDVQVEKWFDLLSSLCEAIGTVKWANEYDFTKEAVHNIFEQDKKEREKLDKTFLNP